MADRYGFYDYESGNTSVATPTTSDPSDYFSGIKPFEQEQEPLPPDVDTKDAGYFYGIKQYEGPYAETEASSSGEPGIVGEFASSLWSSLGSGNARNFG